MGGKVSFGGREGEVLRLGNHYLHELCECFI
jgi:hypothetical protein